MLTTGIKGNSERIVTEELTARAMGSGELPVLATPAAVALAEETACALSGARARDRRHAAAV